MINLKVGQYFKHKNSTPYFIQKIDKDRVIISWDTNTGNGVFYTLSQCHSFIKKGVWIFKNKPTIIIMEQN